MPRPTSSSGDPLLQVTITPSRPFFYAGETFEATIVLRNTRIIKSDSNNVARRSIDLSGANTRTGRPSLDNRRQAGTQTGTEPALERPLERLNLIGRPSEPVQDVIESPVPLSETNGAVPTKKTGVSGRSQSVDLNSLNHPSLPSSFSLPNGIPQSHPHARQSSLSILPAPLSPTGSILSEPPTSPFSELDFDSAQLDTRIDGDYGLESIKEVASPRLGGAEESIPQERLYGSNANAVRRESAGSEVRTGGTFGFSRSSFDFNSRSRSSFSLSRPPPVNNRHTKIPLDDGSLKILWASTRLVGRFTPSTTYIPPDPLLPLRSLMLHQPIGSGSLPFFNSSSDPQTIQEANGTSGSRWDLSFGTGTLPSQRTNESIQIQQPTLTGSLWGLAKGLIGSGKGGSLEQERRKVWGRRELPVLESVQSLVGVDVGVGIGEEKTYVYTLQLPKNLAPSFKGKAMRFHYEISLSLNLNLPGIGLHGRQKQQEVVFPVKVVPTIDMTGFPGAFDILEPVIHRTDQGTVTERKAGKAESPKTRRNRSQDLANLMAFSKRLTEAANGPPIKKDTPEGVEDTPVPEPQPELALADSDTQLGNDELVSQQIRSAKPAHFEIHKHGEPVAEINMARTVYRAGENIVGVVSINEDSWRIQVMKVSAVLVTDEAIPESLLPPSAAHEEPDIPVLRRTISHNSTGFTSSLRRLNVILDIPNEVTPTMTAKAGSEGKPGGLKWLVQVNFLIRRRWSRHTKRPTGTHKNSGEQLPSPPSTPIYNTPTHDRTEVVKCIIPVIVFPRARTQICAGRVFHLKDE